MSDLLKSSASTDFLVRAVHREVALRVVVAVTSDLSRVAAIRHKVSAPVACALSRGLTAGLLLATLSKTEERVTLQLQCDGPLRGLTIDAYDDGAVRGYPGEARPELLSPIATAQRQRLAPLVGYGLLSVVRDIGTQDRYQGQCHIANGELDEDVEHYLRVSEQIPSALGCEVLMDEGGHVVAAAGALVQVLPGGEVERVEAAQAVLRAGGLYQLLVETRGPGLEVQQVCQALLPGLELEYLDTRPLRFQCRCSRERIESMLLGLSVTDLDEMVTEGQSQITCNYCNEVYTIGVDTLMRLRDSKGQSKNPN